MNINSILNDQFSYATSTIESGYTAASEKIQDIYTYCSSFFLEETTPSSPSPTPRNLKDRLNPENLIKKSIDKIKKFYVDHSSGPGLFQFLTFPYELVQSFYSLKDAVKYKSKESILDNRLKVFTILASSVYSLSSLLAAAGEAGATVPGAVSSIASIAPITGVAAALFCGAIEYKNIRRQMEFLRDCETDLALLQTGKTSLKGLSFLQKHVKKSATVDLTDFAKLANRVRPWFAEKIALELPSLLESIQRTKKPALRAKLLEKAIALVSDAKTQAQKKLIHQILTLVCMALMVAGFIGILIAAPYAVPLVIFGVNLVLMGINSIYYAGTRDHTGWEFRTAECIPDWLKI